MPKVLTVLMAKASTGFWPLVTDTWAARPKKSAGWVRKYQVSGRAVRKAAPAKTNRRCQKCRLRW